MSRPRIAFVAGTLGAGGAEQQLVHMVGALLEAGADVRVFALTRRERHAVALRRLGAGPVWVGWSRLPAIRAAAAAAGMVPFRPHIVQSAHFYTNLYAALSARLVGAVSVGAVRSDVTYDSACVPRWHAPLLRLPAELVVNSFRAREAAVAAGRDPATVHFVPNLVDLDRFGEGISQPVNDLPLGPGPIAMAVGGLQPVKRLDRFLHALALARQTRPDLRGVVVGEGPERERLEQLAARLGLGPTDIWFAGVRDDVPGLLARADFLVLSSDHEGSPNVVLEAMAARRAVLSTPCGDVPRLVSHGTTGLIVPFDSPDGLANGMRQLASDPDLCHRMGNAGRRRVEGFGRRELGERLLAIYRGIADRRARARLAAVLP